MVGEILRVTISPSSTAGTLAIIMPSVVPSTTAARGIKARGQRDGGDLRLVGHLGQKKCNYRGAEYAQRRAWRFGCGRIEFVGDQHPRRHAEKRQAEDPAQCVGAEKCCAPGADGAGKGVIGQRRDQDASDDRPRFFETRGQYQRQQLGFVANFSEGDDAGGD